MSASVTVKLRTHVQLGEGAEPVSELVIKPTAGTFKNLSIPTDETGILLQPYPLAAIGVKMAGQPPAFLDHMDPADMMEVAMVVMGFLVPSQPTGVTLLRR